MMGCEALCCSDWLDGRQVDRSGRAIDGAIDKQNRFGAGDIFGKLGGPLLANQDKHAGLGAESFLSPFGEPWADTVIAAQGVAAGEDKAPDFLLGHR